MIWYAVKSAYLGGGIHASYQSEQAAYWATRGTVHLHVVRKADYAALPRIGDRGAPTYAGPCRPEGVE